MKSVEVRIQECMQIRGQLQSMGVLSIPHLAEKLKAKMNSFIKTGESSTFNLSLDQKGTTFQIILTSSENKKSGVRMIAT